MERDEAQRLADAMVADGFDDTIAEQNEDTGAYRVRLKCSQCEALSINGYATHERGCPNSARRAKRRHIPQMSQG